MLTIIICAYDKHVLGFFCQTDNQKGLNQNWKNQNQKLRYKFILEGHCTMKKGLFKKKVSAFHTYYLHRIWLPMQIVFSRDQ